MDTIPPIRSTSQPIAWLGFGISLALFLLTWVIICLILSHIGDSNFRFTGIFMMYFFIGSILGILGLVFSIKGLNAANRYALKKGPSIMGIIFICLTLISFFIPVIAAAVMKGERNEKISHEQLEKTTTATTESAEVILHIDMWGDVKCYKAGSKNSVKMNAHSSYSLKKELNTWLKTNGYNKNVCILIKTDPEIEYHYVVNVLDTLNDLGLDNYTIEAD